jgi:hypothetical protein
MTSMGSAAIGAIGGIVTMALGYYQGLHGR